MVPAPALPAMVQNAGSVIKKVTPDKKGALDRAPFFLAPAYPVAWRQTG